MIEQAKLLLSGSQVINRNF